MSEEKTYKYKTYQDIREEEEFKQKKLVSKKLIIYLICMKCIVIFLIEFQSVKNIIKEWKDILSNSLM